VDQPVATIIGAALTFCGAVAGALISTLWKREPKHQIVEYRLRHDFSDSRTPWLHGDSAPAKTIRGLGWIFVGLTLFFGIPALITVPVMSLLDPISVPRRVIAISIPWGILSLIVCRWVAKRITVPSIEEDDDDDDN
jgi:hypothetical protein